MENTEQHVHVVVCKLYHFTTAGRSAIPQMYGNPGGLGEEGDLPSTLAMQSGMLVPAARSVIPMTVSGAPRSWPMMVTIHTMT